MKTVAILGIQGQMGWYLAHQLLQKNDCRIIGGYSSELKEMIPGIEYEYIDYEDQIGIRRLLHAAQPTEIYNLAALSSTDLCKQDEGKAWRINTLCPIRIIEWLAYRPKSKFIQCGSIDQLNSPPSIYAQTKHEAYKFLAHSRKYNNLHLSHLFLTRNESFRRPQHFFTPKAIAFIAKYFKEGFTETLSVGNLDVQKEWGHASDYAAACVKVMEQDAPNDYYVSSNQRFTNRDFITAALTKLNPALYKEIGSPSTCNAGLWIEGKELFRVVPELQRVERDDVKVNSDLIRSLGWAPQYTFSQIVDEMVNYYMGTYDNQNKTNTTKKTDTVTA